MKIAKITKEEEQKVSRKVISKFGEAIYHCPEVSSVFIKVNFKDGSSIGFRRDENEDDFDRLFIAEDDEKIWFFWFLFLIKSIVTPRIEKEILWTEFNFDSDNK